MTNAHSCPVPAKPGPWPAYLQPLGTLYGNLLLTVPCPTPKFSKVVIIKRKDGITMYNLYKQKSNIVFCAQLDTSNKWMLPCCLSLTPAGDTFCVYMGGVAVACLVAQRFPSEHQNRNIVNHADCNPLNNCLSNLHWVTNVFNNFNMPHQPCNKTTGFCGVCLKGT